MKKLKIRKKLLVAGVLVSLYGGFFLFYKRFTYDIEFNRIVVYNHVIYLNLFHKIEFLLYNKT